MCGVRTAGDRVNHLFGIAVIGGHKHGSAFGADGKFDAAEAGVHGFDGFDGWLELAGMADHVGIGEVDDDDIEGAVFDGFDDGVGDAGSRHFRLQVVCRNFL